MNLSDPETRVLGCLLEKQCTTPELYPLTLNALRSACNQSTSRDPVVDYDDGTIRDALHRLERRGLARLASGRGSRAPKYRHLLAEALPMAPEEQAVMCVLMLRGPQTPGELKARAGRMHEFAALKAVHGALERLLARGLAARLGRRAGQKEERFAHCLGDTSPGARVGVGSLAPVEAASDAGEGLRSAAAPAQPASTMALPAWASALEERVARLERALAELHADPAAPGTGLSSMHAGPAASGSDAHLQPLRS